ncbi:MAG: hypothetical protein R3B09_05790 [Nannocystaceae bacterium]
MKEAVFGIELTSGLDTPAWFVWQVSDSPPRPGELQVALGVTVRSEILAADQEMSAAVRAVKLCSRDRGCEFAVYLAPGQHVAATISAWPQPGFWLEHVEVLQLSELVFDGEPAEVWASRELPPDAWGASKRDLEHTVDRVELTVERRWVLPLDPSMLPKPPSRALAE